ncbi:MAG: isoprenylcysteine carboxylmethyltransferase family protein [Verrucomicrobia bacterium]|nr:isoprenylcysteine carboxylmethyltransferase family protein [Verrucomicrobiota bacterium]
MVRKALEWTIPILWLLWLGYWWFEARNTARTRKSESLLTAVVYRGATVVGIVLIFGLKRQRTELWPADVPLLGIAVILMLCGFAFAIWARRHIGRFWSARVTLKEGHRLIESGPYSLVRHPIYSGLLLSMAATVMTVGTVQSVCGYALLVGALVFKLVAEERLLAANFGEAYQGYQKRVKALIPGVI